MQLFLSGGGDAQQSKKLDQLLVKAMPRGKRMLYIPVAMDERSHTFGDCFDWVRRAFTPHSLTRIDMWTDLSDRTYDELRRYGAVYLGGGNTFGLLHRLRSTGFDKLLARYARDGGLIYGGSAGAIVLGEHIGTAAVGNCSDKNLVRIKDLRGLQLVPYNIHCHYTAKDDVKLSRMARREDKIIIALPEETGLHFMNDSMHVVGYKDATVFSPGGKSALKHS